MSLSTTVASLVAHKSPRPSCFFPSASSSGTACSSSSVLQSENYKHHEMPESQEVCESSFGIRKSFGGFSVSSPSTRNALDRPLIPEGTHTLKLNTGVSFENRTFLKEITSREKVSETKKPLGKDALATVPRTRCSGGQHEALRSDNSKTVPSISCPELVSLLINLEAVMIIDCRNFMAYNANHIQGAVSVNLANKITRKRFVDGHLTIADLLSGQDAKMRYREYDLAIVVYDDNTINMTSLPAAHPLKLLASRLSCEGKDVRYLEGGIQSFQKGFQQFCENPDAEPTPAFLYSPTSQDVDAAVDSALASEILPFLYIGNERDASNEQTLKELGITHILNVTANIPFHFEDRITCKRLQASDSGCQNLKQYFEEAIEFIENARISNGRVLVHCQAGVSRSPTVVMAYVIARFEKSLQDTFAYLHNRRSIISPNLNFMGQLLEFSNRTDLASLCHDRLDREYSELAPN